MTTLEWAYLANVIILIPIAIPTLFGIFPTDESVFQESKGWRMLVGALWLAILLLSCLGLRSPLKFSSVLILQLIYKSAWLAVYALPRFREGKIHEIPRGITISFLMIVLLWPWVIPWAYLLGK